MSLITITIETSNDAFQDGAEGCGTVSQILQGVAGRFRENSHLTGFDGMAVRDPNGNRVGQIDIEHDGDEN